MAENVRTVSIGEMVASDALDDVLVAYGLGSCVAVCLYDPTTKVGGMLHALLPAAAGKDRANGAPTKFVDRGVPLLVDSVLRLGAERSRLVVQVCGGAQVLSAPGFNSTLNIGERNVQAARFALEAAGLRIQASATGGQAGRTVKLHIVNGQITVRSMGQGERALV